MPMRYVRDRWIGLIYLVLVPVVVVVILVLGYLNHREDVSRANRISTRAEAIAQNSCRSAAILRDVLYVVLPAQDPPNLTPTQAKALETFRAAVRQLGPLSCSPKPPERG